MKKFKFNLRFFDGEGTAPEGTAGEAENATDDDLANHEQQQVVYGRQPEKAEEQPEDNETELTYEQFKERFKDEHQKDLQRVIDKRFKNAKKVESERDALKGKIGELTDILGARYGTNDFDELIQALNSDDAYFEAAALQNGMSTEEYRATLKAQRLEKQLSRQEQEAAQAAQVEKWQQEAEELKALYPDFDLAAEIENEKFSKMLQSGESMRDAYQFAHFDDILGGVIQYTAATTKSAVAKAKAERQARPRENGSRSGAGAIVKSNVENLTKEDMDEIERRVMRGEKISF